MLENNVGECIDMDENWLKMLIDLELIEEKLKAMEENKNSD